MGLRSDIQAELAVALDGDLADVVTSFTVAKKGVRGPYNSETDSYDTPVTDYACRGIFGSFGSDELGETDIKITDEKVVVNGADVPVSLKFEVDDILTLDDGKKYILIMARPVMGGDTIEIIWILGAREYAS